MKREGMVRGWMGAGLLVLAAFGWADASPLLAEASEGPQPAAQAAQAVRLSSVEGPVRIAQDGQVLTDPALVNTPLFEGTQVLTSQDGRAELQFEDGSVVRLSPNSSLTLLALQPQGGRGNAEIALESGLGYFELHNEEAASQIRVRFGDSVVTGSGFAVLRIDLDSPPGELAVFSGNAHLERGSALAVDLHGGESVVLSGTDPTQYRLAESIEPNSWDAWNSDRDQALMAAEAAKTGVANNMPGKNNPAWNDLDANGNWYNVPDQGYVWAPYEASNAGWDPYGHGYWMWTPRFGYIWVSGDSWGYLPYQCGAWSFFNDFGWGWAPGGCRPWWGSGIWISNIGRAPGGYRPPLRPHPIQPRGPIGRPHPGIFAAAPNAVVAVNRRPLGDAPRLPMRDRNSIVTIGGRAVQPLRPVLPRPQFDRTNQWPVSRPRPVYAGTSTPAGARPASGAIPGPGRTVYAPVARPTGGIPSTPVYNRPAPRPGVPMPPSHVSSGGASSSHPSNGGGGGGSRVFSGGGGSRGGAGGGSHNSSGGGSHR